MSVQVAVKGDKQTFEPGTDVEVEITHDPPWSPDLMTDLAKRQLGWLR